MVAGMQVLGAIAIGYIISRWGLEEPTQQDPTTRPDNTDVDQDMYEGYTLIKVTHMKTNPDTGSTFGCGQFERRLSDGTLDEVNGRVFVVMGREGTKWLPLGAADADAYFGIYLGEFGYAYLTKAECYAQVDRLASPSDLGDPEVAPEPEETPDPEPPVSPPIFPGGGGMSSGQDLGGHIETDYSGGRRGGMFGY